MHRKCVPTSRQLTKQSKNHADLTSWFSSGGLKATVRVSQMISDERGLCQACRDQTGRKERVRADICIQGYTQFESDSIWHLEPVQHCPRIIPETDARYGSCRTSLAAARRTDCNFSCRHLLGPAARSPLQ